MGDRIKKATPRIVQDVAFPFIIALLLKASISIFFTSASIGLTPGLMKVLLMNPDILLAFGFGEMEVDYFTILKQVINRGSLAGIISVPGEHLRRCAIF